MSTYPRSTWRLIYSAFGRGAWNMAIDEAILEAAIRKEVLPTLRLYGWEPACLSLGYAQASSEVDLQRLEQLGWDLVRRPTGGRAILHVDELTYSVVGTQEDPRLKGSVLESYQNISRALLSALHLLNIPALALPKDPIPQAAKPVNRNAQAANPVCFEEPSNYEITIQGKKLVGSAQARRKEGVLQHGSLPLHGDLARITQALVYPSEEARQAAAQRLLQRATTAEGYLGYALDWNTAAGALVTACEQELNIEFVPGELTLAERQVAEQLMQEKYTNPAWLLRI